MHNSRFTERRAIREPKNSVTKTHKQLDRRAMPENSTEGRLQDANRLSKLKNRLLREKMYKITKYYHDLGKDLNEKEIYEIMSHLENVMDRRIETRLVEARDFADRDATTGLLREEKFKSLVEMYLRENNSGTFIFFDVNFLKKANDKYGHAVGDKLLKSMANALATIAKSEGLTIARLGGGDEFGAFSSSPLTQEKINEIVEKIRRLYKDNWKSERIPDIDASFAIGVTDRSEFSHESNPSILYETLRKVSDARMYSNKKEMKAQRTD